MLTPIDRAAASELGGRRFGPKASFLRRSRNQISSLHLVQAFWIRRVEASTVPNARRLGSAKDPAEEQSRLARTVCRDHMLSFARMIVVLILQLIAR
jgi:hypothetical protein